MHAARNLGLIVLCLAAASCSKLGKGDADAAAEAGPDAAADADVDSGAADAAAADAADAALAPTLTPTTGAAHATGGPFAGAYHCFGGLTLSQNGNLVSGITTNKLSTAVQTIQWNCSVTKPDHCEGTQIVTNRPNDPKQPPKVLENRKLTIDHHADSSVSIHLERSVETTNCRK
jgi:hypothetical protein